MPIFERICRSTARHPWRWFAITGLLCVPALVGISRLALDTDLIRLLPRSSRAAQATRELASAVGGSTTAVMMFEGDGTDRLIEAVQRAAVEVSRLSDVSAVEYEYPLDFFDRYRFLLIPTYYLEQINNLVSGRPARGNRASSRSDLTTAAERDDALSFGERQDRRDINVRIDRYSRLARYHLSDDGRLIGMVVRTKRGVTSLGASRRLMRDLETIAQATGAELGLWAGVAGGLRSRIDEYDVIMQDLRKSGVIAGLAILITLIWSFRSVRIVPVVLLPLAVGLLWGFALVPVTVGSLNLITSFLLIVTFGMGVDYAVHLVKRYQRELVDHDEVVALVETFRSTGASVLVSGITTALALAVLAASRFQGFSEFGIVGALAIGSVLLAMIIVMPAMLIVGRRMHLVSAVTATGRGRRFVPGRLGTTVAVVAVIAAGISAALALRFDYDFNNLRFAVSRGEEVQSRSRGLYRASHTPAASFVVPDLPALDRASAVLEAQRAQPGSTIGRLASVRDLAPTERDAAYRRDLLDTLRYKLRGLRGLLAGSRVRRFATELRAWAGPDHPPGVEDLPELLRLGLMTQDGSDRFLLSVYPNVERRDGANAMAFTEELYAITLPPDVRGPIGETPVLAEILWLVTGEGPWLVALTFAGVFLSVLIHRRSVTGALWMMLPLTSGVIMTLGVMAILGLRLNFFNVVIIPALVGLGVDHGVHYYRRWLERGRDVAATQAELLGPLSVCTATTIMGYAGLIVSNHRGLQSIGIMAVLGLACIWFASLVLLPGVLRRVEGTPSPPTPPSRVAPSIPHPPPAGPAGPAGD